MSRHFFALSVDEVETLYRLLENQYIHYDNKRALKLVSEFRDFLERNGDESTTEEESINTIPEDES